MPGTSAGELLLVGFPGWIRATHLLNILWISLLIRSGLQILAAHPKLYWDDACRPGKEWLRLTRRRMPKDRLWTSMDEEETFNPVVALPGGHGLGLGRHWHFASVLAWLVTGIAYVALLFAAGEWRRIVPTSWSILPDAGQVFLTYAHLRLPPDGNPYNALQELAYFGVVFLLTPLAILSGAAMSPALEGRFPWFERFFRGRQGARSVHFMCLVAYVVFVVVHTAMVVVHGLGKGMAEMWLGSAAANHGAAIAVGLGSIAVVVLLNWAATYVSHHRPRDVQRALGAVLHSPQYRASQVMPARQRHDRQHSFFRINGYPPTDGAYRSMAADGFSSWRLDVDGLVEQKLNLSMAELRTLPQHAQRTKHTCIQGWTAIGEWRGVRLATILERSRPLPRARYVALLAMDDKSLTAAEGEEARGFFYETIPIELARQDQTILAYDFNGDPLTIEHGAPLRLRVENQLGFKMVKWISRIELIDDYGRLGKGRGGWREDHMYYSPAVAI